MKITSINNFKNFIGIALAATTVAVVTPSVKAQNTAQKDTFSLSVTVPPLGTTSDTVLISAPSPKVLVEGETKTAAIVVDLSKNILFRYNEDGQATCAYLVASGKKSSPTETGLRIVTHVEKYPYKSAPKSTKRHRQPRNYGPRTICLEKLDPETGAQSRTGEFIHGNNDPASIGKYESLGCIRMDNNTIKEVAKEVKRGDLVLIKK